MSKFINIHMIRNYPVSCLNRDDSNTPKDCEFGGHARARISSQCLKRAVRLYIRNLLPDKIGVRSRLFPRKLLDKLKGAGLIKDDNDMKISEEIIYRAFSDFVGGTKKDDDEDGGGGEDESEKKVEPRVIMHVPSSYDEVLDEICDFIVKNWCDLSNNIKEDNVKEDDKKSKNNKKKSKKKTEKEKELHKLMEKFVGLDAVTDAVDIALFGRMMAKEGRFNVDGACSVSHSFSTNKIKKDTDYFTAVDELNVKAEVGAGMIGNIDFNSACYYQCVSINYTKLEESLKDDAKDSALKCIEAFVKASPTGKQNTMFAITPPDCILIVIGNQQFTYANAFVDPIRPKEKSLTDHSIDALIKYNDTLVSSSYFKPDNVYIWSLTAQVPNGINNFEEFMRQVGGVL
jgi:CRISPR system Cascade subunit CasC